MRVNHDRPPLADGPTVPVTDLIWLLGQPQLSDYLAFVATKVVDGGSADPRALVAEWRAANDHYYTLEQAEAGEADAIDWRPLEPELADRAAAIERNSWFRASFDNLPYAIGKVELDRLVVSQIHVERGHVHDRAASLDLTDPAALFDFCLPATREIPPVRTRRLSEGRYLFSSPSTDFRAHAPRLLPVAAQGETATSGPLAAMLGLGIGFGSNFLSGIRSGSRILLQNGYHRAYALRSMGATHAYCVVEDVTRKDELRLTATDEVAADPEFYFAAKRPPLLKDFFDPALAKLLKVLPVETHVEVEIVVRSGTSLLS